jgi:hypothetical protein
VTCDAGTVSAESPPGGRSLSIVAENALDCVSLSVVAAAVPTDGSSTAQAAPSATAKRTRILARRLGESVC